MANLLVGVGILPPGEIEAKPGSAPLRPRAAAGPHNLPASNRFAVTVVPIADILAIDDADRLGSVVFVVYLVASDPVSVGDEVVFLGRQGTEEITAEEWADRLDTINYEVVCHFGPRLPRVYTGSSDGE